MTDFCPLKEKKSLVSINLLSEATVKVFFSCPDFLLLREND